MVTKKQSRSFLDFLRSKTFGLALLVTCILLLVLKLNPFQSTSIEQIESGPEQVVEIPETPWVSVTAQPDDNLTWLFKQQKLSEKQLQNIVQLGKPVNALNDIRPGQKISFQINEAHELEGLKLSLPDASTLVIKKAAETYQVDVIPAKIHIKQTVASGVIKSSLYLDAKKLNIPDKVILQFSDVFGWKINFKKSLRKGDQFKVIYEVYDVNHQHKKRFGNIVAAEFIHSGTIYQAIRFEDKNGHAHYYTPTGQSLEPRFLRAPVKYHRISDGFNQTRKHPILHIVRRHLGVDLVAPKGTPIHASADGVVKYQGYHGGYGRMVILNHGAGYSTRYAHLSKYGGRIKKGKIVKRGDVIGYVGSSGLATGPHLHYEFRIHGEAKNPLKVDIPAAKSISRKNKAEFLATSQTLLEGLQQS